MIRKLRKEAHLSQDELARKVGYTDRSSIAKIEAGKVDLPETKIKIFAQALNTTPAELMGIRSAPIHSADILGNEVEKTPTLIIEDERTIEFINLFSQLSETEQDIFLAQIKGVLASR